MCKKVCKEEGTVSFINLRCLMYLYPVIDDHSLMMFRCGGGDGAASLGQGMAEACGSFFSL